MQTINDKQTILMASFALALMLVAMPLIFAEENNSNESIVISTYNNTDSNDSNQILDSETMDEINDDLNESVSDFDIWREKFGLWFTFNQEKKAEKELKLARLELIRARIFAEKNNTAAMEKALEEHNQIMTRLQTRMESMNGASTGNGTIKSAEKLIGLERAIQVHEARIQKLKEILAENTNLTEEQVSIIAEKIAKAENNTQHLNEVQEAHKEKLKTKLMAVGNMTEDEAENEIHELEDGQNLSVVQELIAKKRLSEAKKHLDRFDEKLSEYQNEGLNTTLLEVRISELEQIIEDADLLIQNGDYVAALEKLDQFGKFRMESFKKNMEKTKESREQMREANESHKEQFKKVREQGNQSLETKNED